MNTLVQCLIDELCVQLAAPTSGTRGDPRTCSVGSALPVGLTGKSTEA